MNLPSMNIEKIFNQIIDKTPSDKKNDILNQIIKEIEHKKTKHHFECIKLLNELCDRIQSEKKIGYTYNPFLRDLLQIMNKYQDKVTINWKF